MYFIWENVCLVTWGNVQYVFNVLVMIVPDQREAGSHSNFFCVDDSWTLTHCCPASSFLSCISGELYLWSWCHHAVLITDFRWPIWGASPRGRSVSAHAVRWRLSAAIRMLVFFLSFTDHEGMPDFIQAKEPSLTSIIWISVKHCAEH